jgi:hypothetical protein
VLNPRKQLRQYLRKHFRFIHIGRLDVTVVPLTRLELNTSILVCVMDYRHNRFDQALIAAMEASLSKGEALTSPNMIISLTDPHLNQALRLHTKTKGFDMLEGSVNISISWKLCYRVGDKLNGIPKAPKSFHGYFLQEDVEGRVLTPQKVKPSSVLIPIDWAVKFDENRPKVLTPQASNNSDHIKSLDDGVVRLTLRSRRPDEDQGRMVYPLQSISMITRVQPVDEKKELQRKRFPKT